jgi:uncharacterized membrane protein
VEVRFGASPESAEVARHGTRLTAADGDSRPVAMVPTTMRPPSPRGIGGLALLSLLAFPLPWGRRARAAEASGAAARPEAAGALGHAAEWITAGLEAAGVAVIVLGALATTAVFLRHGLRAGGGGGWEDAYERFRANLGRAILLGLELLVAADIVNTVAAPLDLRAIGTLGLVVLIRTFLSFSLQVEVKGYWPWRESEERRHRSSPSS